MTVNRKKLLAIPLSRLSGEAEIKLFEEVLIFLVLTKLGLLTDIIIRDKALQAERLYLSVGLSYEELVQKLSQYCKSMDCRYLMSGSLSPVYDGFRLDEIKVVFRLFDSRDQRFVVDNVYMFNDFEVIPQEKLPYHRPVLSSFNEMVDWVIQQLIEFILPQQKDQILMKLDQVNTGSSYEALEFLAQAQGLENNKEKIPLYEKAAQLDPQSEVAYHLLAKSYRLEQQYDRSVFYYRKALEVSTASNLVKANYANDAGIGCALLGRPELAIQWWERALALMPEMINPYFNIANTYEDQQRFEEAEKYFLKAQSLAPEDFRTFYNLARVYSKMGRWEQALEQYRFQLTTDSEDPWCHNDLATCYLHVGNPEEARKHLEKAVSLDPKGEAGEYAQLILSGLG